MPNVPSGVLACRCRRDGRRQRSPPPAARDRITRRQLLERLARRRVELRPARSSCVERRLQRRNLFGQLAGGLAVALVLEPQRSRWPIRSDSSSAGSARGRPCASRSGGARPGPSAPRHQQRGAGNGQPPDGPRFSVGDENCVTRRSHAASCDLPSADGPKPARNLRNVAHARGPSQPDFVHLPSYTASGSLNCKASARCRASDAGPALEIGDRPRDPQHARHGPDAQPQPRDALRRAALSARSSAGRQCALQRAARRAARSSTPCRSSCRGARRDHARPDGSLSTRRGAGCAGRAHGTAGRSTPRSKRSRSGPGQPPLIALHGRRRAAARARAAAGVAARTRIHRADEHDARREASTDRAARAMCTTPCSSG